MRQLNLCNLNSKSKITRIIINLGILNKLARLRDMAEKRSRALTIVPKGRIELLNFLDIIKVGDLQND